MLSRQLYAHLLIAGYKELVLSITLTSGRSACLVAALIWEVLQCFSQFALGVAFCVEPCYQFILSMMGCLIAPNLATKKALYFLLVSSAQKTAGFLLRPQRCHVLVLVFRKRAVSVRPSTNSIKGFLFTCHQHFIVPQRSCQDRALLRSKCKRMIYNDKV